MATFQNSPSVRNPDLILQCITFVLLMFTLGPFNSSPSFQHLSFSINSSSVSAIRHKSSAYSSSQGNPALNSLESASNTMMNNSGLSTEPWCTPTFTSKPLLSPYFILIAVVTPAYITLVVLRILLQASHMGIQRKRQH